MTPEQIKATQEGVTQNAVDSLAVYLDNWMSSQKQPSKNLVKLANDMKKEGCNPNRQTLFLLDSLSDWFAYGN